MSKDYSKRFWSKVDIREPEECWAWLAAKAGGQGVFSIGRSTYSARRIAWVFGFNGQVPEDLPHSFNIHTTCDTVDCCNPDHLFLATIWERFARGYEPGEPEECWIWQGTITAAGYGVLNRKKTLFYTHRLAWIVHNSGGDLDPEGLDDYDNLEGHVILHKCDNPPCVNPNHLLIGNQSDNANDAVEKGRWNSEDRSKRLGDEKVKEIRYLIQLGVPATNLAKRFNVHHQTILDIKHGRTWKHVK